MKNATPFGALSSATLNVSAGGWPDAHIFVTISGSYGAACWTPKSQYAPAGVATCSGMTISLNVPAAAA
jgi:hypothetical protein